MDLQEAKAQISAIRSQMARAETFRGYRSITVGCTGVLALLGSIVQAVWIPNPTDRMSVYLTLWIGIAVASMVIPGVEMVYRALLTRSALHRQATRLAVEQFLPCVIAGGLLTLTLTRCSPESLWMLPGLWSIFFSLGVFASRRQLPSESFAVGVYYLIAGLVVLILARDDAALSPWAMAGTFGVGQLMTAAILYFTLERAHEKD